MQLEANLTCPGCKKSFKQKLSEMSPGKSRKCPNCDVIIKFSGDDMAKVQKSIDSLERELKSLNKKFEIKL